MSDWSLLEVIVLVVVLVAGVLAIRIGLSFDITEWMRQRTEKAETRLKLLCPHATFSREQDGRISIQCLLHSPPGTFIWICSRCQLQTTDERLGDDIMQRYARHPDRLIEEDERFRRALKRQYRL